MKKLLFIGVVLLVISSVFLGCSSTSTVTVTGTPELTTVKLSMATLGSPADEARAKDVQETIDVLKDATDGRADVTVHFADTLVPPADYYRAVTEGIADITCFLPSSNPGTFPLQDIFSLPGLFQTQAQSLCVMYELFQKYPQFEAEFDPKVKVLSNCSLMTSDIHSTVPIRTLDDLKGKNIVATSEVAVKILQLLGANGSIMQIPDMYMSAERGVIDGVVVPWGVIDGEKLYEQLTYHTELNVTPIAFCYAMNRDIFNEFTPTQQANLERAWFTLFRPTISRNLGVIINNVYSYTGQEFYSFSDAEYAEIDNLTSPISDEWISKMNSLGYPGDDIYKDAKAWAKPISKTRVEQRTGFFVQKDLK